MDSTYPLTPEEFESIYSRVPRLSIDLVIQTTEGIVLTLRNLPHWNGLWHIPGGTVFYNETIEQAIQRLAQKEVGVRVSDPRLLGYLEYPSEKQERGWGTAVALVFLCTAESMDFKLSNDEAAEIKIFSDLPENIISEQKTFLLEHSEWRERQVDNVAQPQ